MIAPAPATLAPSPRPLPIARTKPSRAPSPIRTRTIVALLLGGICILFAARCWPAVRHDSITSDETTHLIHTLHLFQTGDDLEMWDLGAPRLPHAIGGLASYLALREAGLLPASCTPHSVGKLVLSGMPRVVVPARWVAVAWGIALIGLVFWAAARTRGTSAGLISAAIVSMVPECLAHSSIAGSDMPFTASAFLALILLSRYVEKPSPGRWAAVALAVGLAWSMRHTALLLLMLASGVNLFVAVRRPRGEGRGGFAEAVAGSIIANAFLAVVAFAVLWAGDGFGTLKPGSMPGREKFTQIPSRLGPVDVDRLPVPTSVLSVLKQVRHQNRGHEAFLCGSVRQEGWPSYFPIAFLLKTPTGLIALMVLALARTRLRRPIPWDAVSLAFLGLLWLMLIRNKVNIGVRYALLTYPLAAPFLARLFEPASLRDRVRGPLTIAAVAWFAWASVQAHPRYLSSFNEIGGGPSNGWRYLADSNVDWGQDLDALAPILRKHGITEVTTDISSLRRLNLPGVYAIMNPSKEFQVPGNVPPNRRLYDDEGGSIPVYTRYVAVSASRLHGLYSQNDMSWLRTRRLVDRVGDSIFLFDMDRPADRPL